MSDGGRIIHIPAEKAVLGGGGMSDPLHIDPLPTDKQHDAVVDRWTRVVPRNHVFDGGPHRPREGSSFFLEEGRGEEGTSATHCPLKSSTTPW